MPGPWEADGEVIELCRGAWGGGGQRRKRKKMEKSPGGSGNRSQGVNINHGTIRDHFLKAKMKMMEIRPEKKSWPAGEGVKGSCGKVSGGPQ